MKIYELETSKILTAEELKREANVIAIENLNHQSVMKLIEGGDYASFDEVIIDEKTPDEILKKFEREHLHEDDEVRYFTEGHSIFDVRGSKDQWIRIEVQSSDFIVVPKNLYHRFFAPNKSAKALRLFSGTEGWIPVYRP